jgi:hypothetical protein
MLAIAGIVRCDAVLFATRKFRTESEDRGFGRERSLAVGGAAGGDHVVQCAQADLHIFRGLLGSHPTYCFHGVTLGPNLSLMESL